MTDNSKQAEEINCAKLIISQAEKRENTHRRSYDKRNQRTRLACWNVRSLGNPTKFSSKLINLIETMKQQKLSMLAMSETQWQRSGTIEIEDATVIFSGIDKKQTVTKEV